MFKVMPMYFKQSKYTSFTRKLKRWGFTRVTTGAEQGAYYHKVSYIGGFCVPLYITVYAKIVSLTWLWLCLLFLKSTNCTVLPTWQSSSMYADAVPVLYSIEI